MEGLTVVLFGNSPSVQFEPENILLEGEKPFKTVETSKIVPLQREIAKRHVSVINMIDLHETDSVDHLIDQLVKENEIHAFIFVVRLGQLTDDDKMGLEWVQRVFGDKVLQFVMILFTYEREEESDTINDIKNPVLEQLLEKCGGRFHTCNKMMNNQSEMRDLMNKIELLFNENKQQLYTGEMLKQREDLKTSGCQTYCIPEPTISEERMEDTTTSETGEKHGGKNKDLETRVRQDQCLQQEDTKKRNLFQRLHLEGRQHNKLRTADVPQLTALSLQSHESCSEEELIQTFLQKLLMMDYSARYVNVKGKKQDHKQRRDKNSENQGDICDVFKDLSLSNIETSQSEQIHPMDVQMAVFHCADGFLKQLMVTKLSQCQYALPLLVPDPFTRRIEFPLWTFRQINKSWKIKHTNNETISQTQPIYKASTPMVFFFRFGSVSSSKSQLMNSLINEKHNTFFHRNCPGSSRTRELMDGVVEIAWFCPSGKNADKFTDHVSFCNLHGDARGHEKQLQILTQMASKMNLQ
ncbi:interferon-induced very large GTPase 1-like [Ctenopharyngodon idella]|uniref:interferon-induced very large GTPase 1-like n=1 Tax=Ctenopharyngodon idella TaxID=7959 RepID=UPI00222F7B31|nr:interferon-induced very large GTPase 1-like [Ctenopharyngodon idella]